MNKHVILFLAANPRDSSPLRLSEEAAVIQRELKMSPHRDDFLFESRWAVSIDELMRHLSELAPTVVHFSGHGGRGSGLRLEDEHGDPQLVPARGLAAIIDVAARNTRVVVLNGCYTASQAEVLCTRVDCVVGMDGAVRDDAALAFAARFYAALGNRRSVGNAVAQGGAVLAAKQIPNEALPHCVTRPGVDSYQIVLGPLGGSSTPAVARVKSQRAAAAQSPGLGAHTFVGRDRELKEIESLLTGSTDVQLHAALDGLPGIGKTELARQVVTRLARGQKFPGGIFWFNAEQSDLRPQWARLAEDFGAPPLPDLDAKAAWAARETERRAQSGEAILIVLDNVETWAPPPAPLPDVSAIRLLVTTRIRWLHNSFRPYEVQALQLRHARKLLHSIVGRKLADADELLRALGGHVLSIELAATYLREYGTSPAEYLRQLATGKNPSSSVADQTSYRATAESAFRLLLERLEPALRAAWRLAAQLPPVWFSSELADAIGLDAERRRGLVRLHILERDDRGRHQMHRLLREFALSQETEMTALHEVVIRGATKLLASGDEMSRLQRYRRDAESFEHLVAASADMLGHADRTPGVSGSEPGDVSAARVLFEQALASNLNIYGEEHPKVAADRRNLALLLWHLGDLPTARVLFEQALASNLKTYGEAHPLIAADRVTLAGLLRGLGEVSSARMVLQQALTSALNIHGDDHSKVAAVRTTLARFLQDVGEVFTARVLFEQVLASNIKTYGEDHPTVAADRNNLAGALQQLGDLIGARVLYEQALEIDRKTYGDDDPVVATRRNNLATLLKDLGDLPAARALYEQALAADRKSFGDDHPRVAAYRSNLAVLLRDLGDLPASRVLFEKVLEFDLKTYGDDHPTVATDRNNLALLVQDLGDTSTARVLLEQALASAVRIYSDDHPSVSASRNNLAKLLEELGDLRAAQILYEQALASDLRTVGEDHPTVATDRSNLARVLQQLGDLHAARVLYEQALTSDLKNHGEDHLTVAMDRRNLAGLLQQLGDLPAKRPLYDQSLRLNLRTYGDQQTPVVDRCGNVTSCQGSPDLDKTMFKTPNAHEDFLRLRTSAQHLFNSVDIGLLAAVSTSRFEILSMRMTLGYTTAFAQPVLFEDADWFAARIQVDASVFDTALQHAYAGISLTLPGLKHQCGFSSVPAGWFVNGIHRHEDGVWGAPSLRYHVGGSWGRLFPNHGMYRHWLSRINARADLHDLSELIQRIGIRQPCGQDDHARQIHLELEYPIYLAAHESSDQRTSVHFRTPLALETWRVKWKAGNATGSSALKGTLEDATFILPGRHDSLELTPIFGELSFGTFSTRVRPKAQPPPPIPVSASHSSDRLTLLFLSANPDWQSPLAVEKEQARVATTRNGSKYQNRIAIEASPDLDIVQMTKAMRLHLPAIVHFSGHGEPGGSLLMRDQNGEPFAMKPAGISRLIKQHRSVVRLVVLNACYSDALASMLVDEIECVIGMTSDVLDEAAILFSQSLYSSLFDGMNVEHAFESAAAAVEARYDIETQNLHLQSRRDVSAKALYLFQDDNRP